MKTVTSADGTTIAVETTGTGRPVVLIGGAFNDRSTVAALAATLAPHMTAVTYDRRGRGASGPIGEWISGSSSPDRTSGTDREIEDLAAVIDAVCGSSPAGHSDRT